MFWKSWEKINKNKYVKGNSSLFFSKYMIYVVILAVFFYYFLSWMTAISHLLHCTGFISCLLIIAIPKLGVSQTNAAETTTLLESWNRAKMEWNLWNSPTEKRSTHAKSCAGFARHEISMAFNTAVGFVGKVPNILWMCSSMLCISSNNSARIWKKQNSQFLEEVSVGTIRRRFLEHSD